MRPIVKCVMLIAVLVCDSHQLGTRPSNAGLTNPNRGATPVGSGYSRGMGPYDIEVEVLRICDDPGTLANKYQLQPYVTKSDGVSKIVYRGNFTQPLLEEEFNTVDLKLLVYRSKDKKEFMMLNYTENMCKMSEDAIKDVYNCIRKLVGLGGDECYVPKDFYTFNDAEVIAKLPPPVLEYGNYRATIEALYDNKRFACIEAYGVVKQKS